VDKHHGAKPDERKQKDGWKQMLAHNQPCYNENRGSVSKRDKKRKPPVRGHYGRLGKRGVPLVIHFKAKRTQPRDNQRAENAEYKPHKFFYRVHAKVYLFFSPKITKRAFSMGAQKADFRFHIQPSVFFCCKNAVSALFSAIEKRAENRR
jgi:hypothetical protein